MGKRHTRPNSHSKVEAHILEHLTSPWSDEYASNPGFIRRHDLSCEIASFRYKTESQRDATEPDAHRCSRHRVQSLVAGSYCYYSNRESWQAIFCD